MAQKHNISDTEYPMTRMGTIQQPSRRYRRLRHPSFTAAIWTANNPLLQRGEFGSEIDTGKLKVGDGVTYWNDLGYVAASEIAFADITGSPDDNVALKNALDAKQDVLTEGTGIDIDSDNIISNTGVRSVATGTTNGTISVNTGGTSAEVAVYGLGSAAYTASSDYATAAQGILASTAVQPGDLATVATSGAFSDLTGKPTTLSGYGITDGANTSLSNLTSTGANISNWSSNVSNCITEIPQDINLELSGGTLTLKSGSKITSPDGTQATITVDRTGTMTSAGQYFVLANKNNGALQLGTSNAVSLCGSGSSLPADGNTYKVFFNTTDSKIYRWNGSAWVEWSVAFPLAIITVSGGAISSIDQVFNGFGYIGSTVFALPGVKYLCPDGRNADGTLKNTSATIQNVIAKTVPTNLGWHYLTLNSAGTNGDLATNFYEGTERPSNPTTYSRYYNSVENKIYNIVSGVYGSAVQAIIPIRIEHDSSSPYSITSWNSPTVFHAVDYNDTEFIAHQAMPSDRYVDLTLPADGGSITSPADGYFYLSKNSTATGQRIRLFNYTNSMCVALWSSGTQNLEVCLPVSKGDVVRTVYSADGTTNAFRFLYANGVK